MKWDSDFMEKVFKAIIAVLGIFLGYNQYQEHEEHKKIESAVYDLAIVMDNVGLLPDLEMAPTPKKQDEYMVNL